jgi:polar amino acid transport system substrate-binding protein
LGGEGLRKWIVGLTVCAILSIAAAAVIVNVTRESALVVGTAIPYPPFEYIQVNQAGGVSVGGFDIDLARYVAQQSGYQNITVKVMPINQLVPALDSGQIDMIASGFSLNYTDDPNVAYSVPYWEASQSLVVWSEGSFHPTGTRDLVGRNIAAIDLISQRRLVKTELYTVVGVTNKVSVCFNANGPCVYRYTSLTLALADLQTSRLDGVVIDTPVARALTSLFHVSFAFKFYDGPNYAFVVRKDHTRLLSLINNSLNAFIGTPDWGEMVYANFRS